MNVSYEILLNLKIEFLELIDLLLDCSYFWSKEIRHLTFWFPLVVLQFYSFLILLVSLEHLQCLYDVGIVLDDLGLVRQEVLKITVNLLVLNSNIFDHFVQNWDSFGDRILDRDEGDNGLFLKILNNVQKG